MPAATHVVTLTPGNSTAAPYLSSVPERTTARYLGTPCRTELAAHVGETVTVTLELRTDTPTSIRVYPYQGNGITIADTVNFYTNAAYQRFSFVTTVKNWGDNNPTYSPGEIGVYDSSDAGGTVYVRNMTVRAGTLSTVTNVITDPATTGTAPWTGCAYSGGVATVNAAQAYTANFACVVGQKLSSVVVLRNPTAAAITTYLQVRGTVGGLFTGGSLGPQTPFTIPAGATLTLRANHTAAGTDDGTRIFLPGAVGLVIENALLTIGAATYDGPYFDGNTPDTPDTVYEWLSAAAASPSARTSVVAVDITCLVDDVSIMHGRDDTTSQPEASSATLELSRDGLGQFGLPGTLEIGAVVQVTTKTGTNTTTTRFYGTITDITLAWDDDGEDTPDAGVGQVICTGPLDTTARRVVGDVPWPQELDGARVSRIMAAAGVNLNPATSDPGLVAVLARDVDSQAALDLAREIGDSAGGLVWETRAGDIRYADAAHRRGIPSSLTLDACDVLVSPSWRRTLDGLINSVSLGYGVAPDGGEQPRYIASNASSIAKFGTLAASITTQLAALADATAMGNLMMGRNASPVWVMAALPVDVLGLDAARYDALLALDVHSLVTLTGLPAIGSAPTTATLWVEGIRETLGYGVHDIELVVSGYCRTAPPPRWDDVDPSYTWDQMGTLTWDGSYCLGPPVNYGRWNDVPASLRWDAVAANVTWDTWV